MWRILVKSQNVENTCEITSPGEMKIPKLWAFALDLVSQEAKHLGLAMVCCCKERCFSKIVIHRQQLRSQAQHFLSKLRHVGGGGLVKHCVSERVPSRECFTIVLDGVKDVSA